MTDATTIEPLVTVNQLAAHLGVTSRTLHNWRDRGMPHYLLPGHTLRFRISEVEAWMRVNGSDSEQAGAAA